MHLLGETDTFECVQTEDDIDKPQTVKNLEGIYDGNGEYLFVVYKTFSLIIASIFKIFQNMCSGRWRRNRRHNSRDKNRKQNFTKAT